jgi:hypothetical protein
MIVAQRSEDGVAGSGAGQLVLSAWNTVDGNKIPTAFGDPLRDVVKQCFSRRQIHDGSMEKSHLPRKRENW